MSVSCTALLDTQLGTLKTAYDIYALIDLWAGSDAKRQDRRPIKIEIWKFIYRYKPLQKFRSETQNFAIDNGLF